MQRRTALGTTGNVRRGCEVELFGVGNVVLVRGGPEGGRNMYCDGCGRPFTFGTRYCSSCGKQLTTGPAAPSVPAAVAARATGDGRVRRNINIVAGFWLASGILRLIAVGGMMIFHRLFFQDGWGWPGSARWPFGGSFGFSPFLMGGMFSAGIFLALFGGVHLFLAWGLSERQPWARILGIVIGFLALIRFPFGTALGIYTLWVLLPESSTREYDEMAGVRGQVSVAR
jgi:hypothetical protein